MTRESRTSQWIGGTGRLLAVILMLAGIGSTRADDPSANDAAATQDAAVTVQPSTQEETYTVDTLGTALAELGFQPQRREHAGRTHYDMTLSASSIIVVCSAQIEPQRKNIWLSLYLTTIQQQDAVPTAVWLSMMDANNKGYCYFESYPQPDGARTLYLTTYVDNTQLTRDELRDRIGIICHFAVETKDLWNKDKWTSDQPPAPPTPPALPAFPALSPSLLSGARPQ